MPEVITKHPDVVKEVLRSAGAKCGAGEPQKILTKCPPEQFCALPGGEICVFPVAGLERMTQLSRAEVCAARTETPPAGQAPLGKAASGGSVALLLPLALAVALVARGLRGRR
jgi:hypothetical protein